MMAGDQDDGRQRDSERDGAQPLSRPMADKETVSVTERSLSLVPVRPGLVQAVNRADPADCRTAMNASARSPTTTMSVGSDKQKKLLRCDREPDRSGDYVGILG